MWLRLTTPEGKQILVNMDQVTEVWPSGAGSTLFYAFVDPGEHLNSTDVRETPDDILYKLRTP